MPSEFDYSLLDAIIKHRFREGPGSVDVRLGNYEFFKSDDCSQVLSVGARLIPGTRITMAIFVGNQAYDDGRCPVWRCGSWLTAKAQGGGRIWSVLYDLSDYDDLFTVSLHILAVNAKSGLVALTDNAICSMKSSVKHMDYQRYLSGGIVMDFVRIIICPSFSSFWNFK